MFRYGCHEAVPGNSAVFVRQLLSMVKSFQQPPEELAYQHIKHTIAEFGIRKFMFSDESAHPIVLEYISRRLLSDGLSTNWIAHTRVAGC